MKLALKTIGIAIFSISVLVSFGLTSNQAFAGGPETCEACDRIFQQCTAGPTLCKEQLEQCEKDAGLMCRSAIGGDMIQMESTSILAAGAQYTAAWMIPVIVSGIGIAIVIARKF